VREGGAEEVEMRGVQGRRRGREGEGGEGRDGEERRNFARQNL
jgi:hypothetical protein